MGLLRVPMDLRSAIEERVDEAHGPRIFDQTTDSRVPRGRERGPWASFECPWAFMNAIERHIRVPMGLISSKQARATPPPPRTPPPAPRARVPELPTRPVPAAAPPPPPRAV